MTNAIITRVIRTALSLLTLGAAGTCPILTAAMPPTAFARLPGQEAGPHEEIDISILWRYLEQATDRPANEAFGLFGLSDSSLASPELQPRSFIEEIAAQMEGPDLGVGYLFGVRSGINPDYEPSPSHFLPTWSNGWSDGAPLLLFNRTNSSAEPWSPTGWQHEGLKRVATTKSDMDWGALSSKVAVHDRDPLLDPAYHNTWETDETLRLPVAGSLFLFGQLGASRPDVEQRQMKWLGKTGVGVKLKPWLLEEVQVRGGPAVRYDDTGPLSSGQSPERSELFLEAVTKLPLPVVGPLNLEYTSYAVPPATAADRSQVNQDFKVALPLSSGGQIHVGAKYRWEATPSTTPWVDRMQIYMGLQLKR